MAKKQKVLQNDSIFNELDVDGDGVITDEEMKQAEELMRLEQERERFKNEDAKEDQIRAMAWFALWGMLLYPVLILITSLVGVDKAAQIIGDIAPTYFVAISALVAAYFGPNPYVDKKK